MPYKDKSKEKDYQQNYRKQNKEKNKEYQKEYRKENQEKIKETKKKNYLKNREHYMKKQRKYYVEKGKEQNLKRRNKKRVYQQDYVKNSNNQLKLKARATTQLIVVDGLCEICFNNIATEKHHLDYNNPTQIQFVCGPCHRQIHGYGLIAVGVN